MPYDYSRTDRIGEQIKRELALLIRTEVKDPRVGMVSILDVVVTKDLTQAKVYFDTIEQNKREECQRGLTRAAGFLRSALSRTIQLRNTPALIFIYDDTEQKANELSVLIDKAILSDQKDN